MKLNYRLIGDLEDERLGVEKLLPFHNGTGFERAGVGNSEEEGKREERFECGDFEGLEDEEF